MQVDAYSAILIIERVDSERDSGNYTCRISNSVDEVHKTNELVVRGTVVSVQLSFSLSLLLHLTCLVIATTTSTTPSAPALYFLYFFFFRWHRHQQTHSTLFAQIPYFTTHITISNKI